MATWDRDSRLNQRNGEILGLEWCEVKFIVAIEYDKLLIQKVGSVKVVGQAI
ncbi:hypothetical protein ACS0TY_027866 [Phlomoides rotata]